MNDSRDRGDLLASLWHTKFTAEWARSIEAASQSGRGSVPGGPEAEAALPDLSGTGAGFREISFRPGLGPASRHHIQSRWPATCPLSTL